MTLVIKELKNLYGYKIHIFSYRAWPDTSYLETKKNITLKKWWYYDIENFKLNLIPFFKCFFPKRLLVKAKLNLIKYFRIDLPLFKVFSATNLYSRKLRFNTIKRITRRWLRDKKIPYDKLTLETNSIDVKSMKLGIWKNPKSSFKNRYYYTYKKSFRYFVEDDLKNAIKLCSSCEYVFLFIHPYNLDIKDKVPVNLIPVNSWSEIKEHIRNLG